MAGPSRSGSYEWTQRPLAQLDLVLVLDLPNLEPHSRVSVLANDLKDDDVARCRVGASRLLSAPKYSCLPE